LTSSIVTSRHAAEAGGVRPWQVAFDSYEFVMTNAGALFRAVRLPAVLMTATALLTLKTYFVYLAIYWNSPSVRVASIAVSALVVGVILCALACVAASSNVARVVHGTSDAQLRGMEARLFAAVLRFLAVSVAVLMVIATLTMVAGARLAPHLARYAAWTGWTVAGLFVLVSSVRCGFLAPALSATERRSVLRRGWQLSSGHAWQVAVVWLMLTALPAAVLQVFGEFVVMRIADASVVTLAQGAGRLAADNLALLAIAISLVIAAVASAVLTTIGSFAVAERLAEQS
jgi:hypothetical protein